MVNIVQPSIKTTKEFHFEDVKENKFSNGLPYYIIKAGEQEIIKVDFLFDAGMVFNENPLVAELTNELLEAGTSKKTSEEIAEELDFYGAYLELDISQHFSIVSFYTLNKYFSETLSIVEHIIFNANFPKHEINICLQNKLQRYKISRQKTEVISQELFLENIFGSSHPYGRNITEEDFESINQKDIMNFYSDRYNLSNLKILISGNVKEEHIIKLEKLFGEGKIKEKANNKDIDIKSNVKTKKVFSEIAETMQSSIKIGKETINKHHPDFFNLSISSIILGGYFGSRLMTNIREDKGYTYGIHSTNMSIQEAGFFMISAASGKDVYEKAIIEIYKELKILRTELVSEKELQRVKNYLTGTLAKMFDGVFAKSNVFLALLTYNLNFNYYQKYFEIIKTISPEIIKATAEKYLNENDMIEVVVGAKS